MVATTEILASEVDPSRLYHQEVAISRVASLVRSLMKDKGVTNADLARKLGKDPGYVSRVLAGKMNMTLSTAVDILWALDSSIEVSAKPILTQDIPAQFVRRPGWAEGWESASEMPFWSRGRSNEGIVG